MWIGRNPKSQGIKPVILPPKACEYMIFLWRNPQYSCIYLHVFALILKPALPQFVTARYVAFSVSLAFLACRNAARVVWVPSPLSKGPSQVLKHGWTWGHDGQQYATSLLQRVCIPRPFRPLSPSWPVKSIWLGTPRQSTVLFGTFWGHTIS